MRAALLLTSVAVLVAAPAAAEPVLLISIDGLRPGDVTEAEQRGLKIPNIRRFVTEGAHASAVRGVLPTVTYPSHTTLITGVAPAKHGVVSNNSFDPTQINQGGWYWYARDIKVPTLWSAAAAAGLSVGNVHWPVSVDAPGIRWNLPQIWRTGHGDDAKLVSALSTPGLVAELEAAAGEPYAAGIDESITGDENRARFTVQLIAAHKPQFLTTYFTALDHEQHLAGPDTPEAKAVLERIDAIIGQVVAAQLAAHPDSVIAIASDHGFEPITREVNFFRAFIDAGLITLDPSGKVSSWQAMPWPSGGSVAIMLAKPKDPALQQRVSKLLTELRSDAANGIADIAEPTQIAAMGGNPGASFFINLAPDTSSGGFKADAPLRSTPYYKGTHGYFPQVRHLRSSFMMMGKGIPAGKQLGEIDMRAIAPTLARCLGVALPDAEAAALPLC